MSDSDLTSTASRTPLLMSVQAGMAAGATVAVALRFGTRIWITHNVGVDDWLMLVALVFSWGVSGPGLASAHYGMGRHIGTLTGYQIEKAIMWVWYARLSTIVAFCFVKLAIAALLLRVVTVTQKSRYVLYGSIIVNVSVSIIWFIMTIKCIPASANWKSVEGAKCIDSTITTNHAYFAGAAHSALDLLYVIVPAFLVWGLQLPLRTKLGLILLLSLGLFACACSVIKTTYSARLGQTNDLTYAFTDLSIWNMVELNVGIICGSIPAFRPLFKKIYDKTSTVVRSSTPGQNTGGWNGIGSNNQTAKRSKYGNLSGHQPDYHMTSFQRKSDKTIDDDGNSTENILPSNDATIVRTTEVEVKYNQGWSESPTTRTAGKGF